MSASARGAASVLISSETVPGPGNRFPGTGYRLPTPDSRLPTPDSVTIQLNGEPHDLPGPLTVAALLARLDIDGRRVAVELNEVVVKRAAYEDTLVGDGDAVEVVNFVGGG